LVPVTESLWPEICVYWFQVMPTRRLSHLTSTEAFYYVSPVLFFTLYIPRPSIILRSPAGSNSTFLITHSGFVYIYLLCIINLSACQTVWRRMYGWLSIMNLKCNMERSYNSFIWYITPVISHGDWSIQPQKLIKMKCLCIGNGGLNLELSLTNE